MARLIRVNWKMLCGSLAPGGPPTGRGPVGHTALRERSEDKCGQAFAARLQALGLSGRIQTAFIERLNLTLRRSLAPLARRSWSTAQLPGELYLHLEWWRARFASFRPTASGPASKTRSASSARRSTPASTFHGPHARDPCTAQHSAGVAVGFTSRPWSAGQVEALNPKIRPAILCSNYPCQEK